MCPNCITQGSWVWIGPGLICLLFGLSAYLFFKQAKDDGQFDGDEEEAKHVFDESFS